MYLSSNLSSIYLSIYLSSIDQLIYYHYLSIYLSSIDQLIYYHYLSIYLSIYLSSIDQLIYYHLSILVNGSKWPNHYHCLALGVRMEHTDSKTLTFYSIHFCTIEILIGRSVTKKF